MQCLGFQVDISNGCLCPVVTTGACHQAPAEDTADEGHNQQVI